MFKILIKNLNLVNDPAIKSSILRVIKHEFKNKDKISNEMNADTAATKLNYQLLAKRFSKSDKIQGFIQEHMLDPFGCLLISQLQVIKFTSSNCHSD
jgi:hypothetical protein